MEDQENLLDDDFNDDFVEESDYSEPVDTGENVVENKKSSKTPLSKEEKKKKKAIKYAKHRHGKNFGLWLLGFFLGIVFLVGSLVLSLAVIPLKTFVGEDGTTVSKEVSQGSLLNTITNIKNYGMGDFPILNDAIDGIMVSTGLNGIIELDTEKLKTLKFFYEDGSTNFGNELQKCLKISPELFGDLQDLDAFKTTKAADSIDEIDVTDTYFQPRLYYYVASGSHEAGTAVYERAFYDSGNKVAEATGPIYYLALTDLPLGDMKNLISDRISLLSVSNIVGTLGAGLSSEIEAIIGDMTLAGLSTFNFNTVKLSTVLPTDTNAQLYDILLDLTGTSSDDVTIGDLTNIDVNDLKLQAFLENNTDMLSILCEAVTYDDGTHPALEDLTLGHLNNDPEKECTFNIQDITLAKVFPVSGNEALYDTLCSLSGVSNPNLIKISDLQGADINDLYLQDVISGNDTILEILCECVVLDNGTHPTLDTLTLGQIADPTSNGATFDMAGITLSKVMAVDDNQGIFDILADLTGKSASTITIADLKNCNIANVKISSFIDTEDEEGTPINVELYNALKDLTGVNDITLITVGDLDGKDFNNVKLTSFLAESENTQLYNILKDATGVATATDIKIGDLIGLQMGRVKIQTVIEGGTLTNDLFKILAEATNKDPEEVTVFDVENNFNIEAVKLSTVLAPSNNAILNALISDETVTLGNLGPKVNALSITTMFPNEVFVEDIVNGKPYKKVGDNYELISDSELATFEGTKYYISEDAGFWAMVYYDIAGTDANGYATAYNYVDVRIGAVSGFSSLEQRMVDVKNDVMDISIRQLVLCGLLDDAGKTWTETMYGKSFNELLQIITDNISGIPELN